MHPSGPYLRGGGGLRWVCVSKRGMYDCLVALRHQKVIYVAHRPGRMQTPSHSRQPPDPGRGVEVRERPILSAVCGSLVPTHLPIRPSTKRSSSTIQSTLVSPLFRRILTSPPYFLPILCVCRPRDHNKATVNQPVSLSCVLRIPSKTRCTS